MLKQSSNENNIDMIFVFCAQFYKIFERVLYPRMHACGIHFLVEFCFSYLYCQMCWWPTVLAFYLNVFFQIVSGQQSLEEEDHELYCMTDYENIQVESSYTGPHLTYPLTSAHIKMLIESFKSGQVNRLLLWRIILLPVKLWLIAFKNKIAGYRNRSFFTVNLI